MLVKTRNRFDNSTKINDELFLLTKELEKDFITELFGNKIKDNQYGVDTSNIETSILLAIEKIYSENENIDINNIKYAVFYDSHFKGVYLMIGEEKYIIDYRTLSQDIDYTKFKKFSDCGFSKEDMDIYTREYNIDISNAEFATIINPVSRMTFIVSNGKLYNYHGEEIIIDNFSNYSVDIKGNKAHSK